MSDPRSDLVRATGQVGGRIRARLPKYVFITLVALVWVLALVVFSLFVCVPAVRELWNLWEYLHTTAGD